MSNTPLPTRPTRPRTPALRPLVCALTVACAGSVGAQTPAPAPAPATASAATPAPAAEPRFDIWEYAIEGNTVLPVVELERAVLPHLGPQRTMTDVEAARAALEAAFQRAGRLTVVVDVPEQRVDDGVVRLQIIEGRVDRLRVTGARYHSPGFIRQVASAAAEGEVPDFNALQAQLATLNRTEDRRVQPVLRPGRYPGTVEVDLQVKDELPLTASVELNNQHARDTEPLRLNGTVRWGNLFQRDHTLALTGIVSPQATEQSQVLVANYGLPLDDGASFSSYAVWSNSAVTSLGGSTALGKGLTLGLRWSLPFGAGTGSSHVLTAGLDYKDLEETLVFGADTIDTPVRYLPFQLAWSGSFEHDAGARSQAGATLLWTFRPLLADTVPCPGADGIVRPTDPFACKRSGADGGFAVLRLDARHQRPLGFAGLTGALRLQAQMASQPLVSAEQMAIGGANTVRGYLESEASGDDGLLGSFELRSRNYAADLGFGLKDLTLLAFADAARVRTRQPLFGQAARTPLAGAGFGLRVATDFGLQADLDIARAVKDTPASPAGSHRVHFRLGLAL